MIKYNYIGDGSIMLEAQYLIKKEGLIVEKDIPALEAHIKSGILVKTIVDTVTPKVETVKVESSKEVKVEKPVIKETPKEVVAVPEPKKDTKK